MSVISGDIKTVVNILDTLVAGSARHASVIVPFQFEKKQTYTDGTTANKCNRIYYFSGSAVATPTIKDLSAIICIDATVGMTNVREWILFNDATNDAYILTHGGGTTPFQPWLAGTTPTEICQPGETLRHSKPLGTAGHAVSTAINMKFDPGANTVAFRLLVMGN